MKPSTYLSTSRGWYRVIDELGMPVTTDRLTPRAAALAANRTDLLAQPMWNGDRSEWVHPDSDLTSEIEIMKIKHDVNGNPRRVIHWTALEREKDFSQLLSDRYAAVLRVAREYGGKKFHNKQYGGGVVFQAYSDDEVLDIRRRIIWGDDK